LPLSAIIVNNSQKADLLTNTLWHGREDAMKRRSIVSPEDQSVTFVELFFDLVFVFSVTQVVSFFHHGVTWLAAGQAVLVFWLIWWAWTQFTWALNAADTTHHFIGIGVLVATGIAFFMAVGVPDAFGHRSLLFAIFYVLARSIGLILYVWVASEDPAQGAGVRTFAALSTSGLLAVLAGGYLGGTKQYWLWGLAILLDLIAAGVAGKFEGWNLHADHFSERHGLFIIIVLGETLVVTAGGVTNASWNPQLIAIAVLVVAITCGLWWSYFSRLKPLLDRALAARRGADQARAARDTYSLLHFIVIFGLIAFAVTVEESVAHPGAPLSMAGRGALAAALMIFVGGMGLAAWRSLGRLCLFRIILTVMTATLIVFIPGMPGTITLGITFTGILAICITEQRIIPPEIKAVE
jgi:low temperature requirement protein LtrA